MARVLVVSADSDLNASVAAAAREARMDTLAAPSAPLAESGLGPPFPDLIVLDPRTPDLDAYAYLSRATALTRAGVVFVVPAGADRHEAIVCLEAGADDCVASPVHPRELAARLRALLRRGAPGGALTQGEARFAGITVDRQARRATVRGRELRLAPKECEVLWLLATQPGVARSREEMLYLVWGRERGSSTETVDTHIKRIRRKLAAAGCTCCAIEVVWGYGYRLAAGPFGVEESGPPTDPGAGPTRSR